MYIPAASCLPTLELCLTTKVTSPTSDTNRYRPEPSVLTALRTPRILLKEALAGLVVALALIPEAISFSIIAGVDPKVGLFSSFIMAVTIAWWVGAQHDFCRHRCGCLGGCAGGP